MAFSTDTETLTTTIVNNPISVTVKKNNNYTITAGNVKLNSTTIDTNGNFILPGYIKLTNLSNSSLPTDLTNTNIIYSDEIGDLMWKDKNILIEDDDVTVNSLIVSSRELSIGGVDYTWPSTNGTHFQVLTSDGNGALEWTDANTVQNSLSNLNDTNIDDVSVGDMIHIQSVSGFLKWVNTKSLSGLTIDNTIIGGTTPAAGNFTSLTTSGTSTISALNVSNDTSITGDLTVSSATVLEDTLAVSGDTTINGDLTLNGDLTISGSSITSILNSLELGYIDGITEGTATASKALVVDSNIDIVGINQLSATTLTGTISTATQPNITSIGTLSNLTVSGISNLNGGINVNTNKFTVSSSGNTTIAGTLTASNGIIGNVTGNLIGDVTGDVIGDLTGNVTGNLTGIVSGNLIGNVTGNVTGNLTGNVTGDVTGDLTGDVTGDLTGDVTGNVTGDLIGNVTGNLTGNVTGNLTGDITGDLTGNVLTASQTNITSVGSLVSLIVNGTTTLNNDINLSNGAIDIDLIDNTSAAISFDATDKTGILAINTINGSENVSMSGSLNVSGTITTGTYTLPSADGTENQVLVTDGSGTLYWGNSSNITINGDQDNRIITAGGDSTLNGEANLTFNGSILNVVGGTAISNTLTVSGATVLNGGLTMDTNKFIVADTTGNTSIGGILNVSGITTLLSNLNVSGTTGIDGNFDIATNKFTVASASGNTSIAGTLSVASTLSSASGSTIGNLTLANGSITDSSGSISFGNENLSTSGTLSSGALTVSGNVSISTGIIDSNSNEIITLTATSSAVNELTIANASTGNNPVISATGGDTNIGLSFQSKGTGTYNFLSTATTATKLVLYEDTDNGSNTIILKAPDAITSSITLTLPDGDGNADQVLKTDGSGNLSWTNQSGGSTTITNDTNNYIITAVGDGSLNGEANLTFDGSTLALTGNQTISSTLDVSGATGIDGNFDIATNKFTVASASGNTSIAGTLSVTSTLSTASGSTIGNLTLANGSITDSSGSISFGNENLSTTGTLDSGVLTASSGSSIGTLTLANGSITDSSGSIDFGNENLNTTGTLSSGTLTVSGTVSISTGIIDSNSNEIITLTATSSAVNELTIANASTGNNPVISATGEDTNIGLSFQSKGTGTYNFLSTATTATKLVLYEDTDNGSNTIILKAPDAITSSITLTLPDGDGNADQVLKTDGSGNLSWVDQSGGSTTITNNTNNYIITAVGDGSLNGEANLTFDGSTLTLTGNQTISSTLNVTGATGIDGDFDIATNKFTVASASGNTSIAGTLSVTSTLSTASGSTIGNLTLANGSITDSSGTISFGNENLSTTGTLDSGVLTASSGSSIGTLTLADGSITDSSGSIDFGNENLSTTGTITGAIWNGSTIGVAYGGTGVTSLTSNGILTGNGTSAIQSESNLTFDGSILTVQNTTDASSNQVIILKSGNRTTAVNNDEGYISLYNDNDLGNQVEFSRISWKATDVTNDSKDSQIEFDTMLADSLVTSLIVNGNGIVIKNSGKIVIGSIDIIVDSSGITTLSNIDAIDATTEATIETAIDTLLNLTTVGTLNSGAISSGFGNIDIGTSTLESGDTIINGTLDVTGATGIDGNFDIATNKFIVASASGNTTIAGTLGVAGATGIDGNFDIATNKFTIASASGNTLIGGTLTVTNITALNGGLTMDTNKFTVADTTGNVSTAGTLTVTGATTLSSTLAVSGATGIDGNFDINTNKFIIASASGNTTIAGTLGVSGTTTLSTLTVSGATSLNGGLTMDTDKFVVSDTTGNVSTAGTLTVTGATTLSSTLDITGNTGIDGDFDINTNKFMIASASGNTTIVGTLDVTGDADFGTISSGTWNGTAIGSGYGGTGQDFSASTGIIKVSSGTFSAVSNINLTSEVTGTLPVGNGGTGATNLNSNGILTGNGTSAIQSESNLTFNGSTLTLTGNMIVDGDINTTPGDGSMIHLDTSTITDTNTTTSGTADLFASVVLEGPTLAAANASVTTTEATTVYINGAPSAGTNQTIDNAYALYVNGDTKITGSITITGTTSMENITIIETIDPTIKLSSGVTGTPDNDIGFVGERGDEDNIGFIWDESETEFACVFITDDAQLDLTGSSQNITFTGYANLHVGNLLMDDNKNLYIGTGNDFNINHDATDTTITSNTGNLIIDNTNVTGTTIVQLGTDTSATSFNVRNNSNTTILSVASDSSVDITGTLDVSSTTTLSGTTVISGGTISTTTNTTWSLNDNSSIALNIGSTGLTNLINIDTTNSNETVTVNGKFVAAKGHYLNRHNVNSSSYTILSTDDIIGVTYTTTGTVTLTLPSVSATGSGKIFYIKDEGGNANTYNITINPNGSDTIDGTSSLTISNNYNVYTLYSDGSSGWFAF